jgi:hypothetical protein
MALSEVHLLCGLFLWALFVAVVAMPIRPFALSFVAAVTAYAAGLVAFGFMLFSNRPHVSPDVAIMEMLGSSTPSPESTDSSSRGVRNSQQEGARRHTAE